jgi:hypothetical protein
MATRVLLVGLLLVALHTAGEEGPPRFLIGVYMQPVESFDTWKARGINTLVGYESRSGQVSNRQWSEAATGKGFDYIRRPPKDATREELAADAKDPRLLAWMHHDEPDVKKPPTDPKELAADYARWKEAAPRKPVFINFSGGNVLDLRASREMYLAYMRSADWIANDIYPVTGWNQPGWLWKVGAAVDRLRVWSGGKPQYCFIETSNQRLPWTPRTTRGVTAAEFRAEVWHAVIHGVRGVIYFPQQLGDKGAVPFRYDATPHKVVEEMVRQDARLSELGAALVSPMNPESVRVSAGRPLEVGWRVHGGEVYVIALNFSDAETKGEVVIGGAAEGRFADDFGPYEVRVYRVRGVK